MTVWVVQGSPTFDTTHWQTEPFLVTREQIEAKAKTVTSFIQFDTSGYDVYFLGAH